MEKSLLSAIGIFLLCWYLSSFSYGLVIWFLWGAYPGSIPPLTLICSILVSVFYRRGTIAWTGFFDEFLHDSNEQGLAAVLLSISIGLAIAYLSYLLGLFFMGPEDLKELEQLYLSQTNDSLHSDSYFGTPETWANFFMGIRAQAAQAYLEISLHNPQFNHILVAFLFLIIPSFFISMLIAGVTSAIYRAGSFLREILGRSAEE